MWFLRNEPPQRVNNVDVVKEVNDEIFLFVLGVSETDIQVPQNNWGATRWASFPGHPKILHPHLVSGGNAHAHAIKSLVASDELDREEIWCDNTRRFHLYPPKFSFHKRAIPPWLWLTAFDARIFTPTQDESDDCPLPLPPSKRPLQHPSVLNP